MKIIPTFTCAALALYSVCAGAQGSLAGTVYDSLSTYAPLANATVVLVERNKYATSDARGHFRIDSVPDGHYTLGVMHPILDSLELTAPLIAVDVSGGREATVTLTTPSARTALAQICPGANAEYSGVIIGRVRDVDDGSALALATVSTDWTEFTVTNGKSASRRVRAKIQTKPNGVYLLCNVPIKVPLEVLGIRPELIEPASPQQNARHERMHRTLKAEATTPPTATMRAQQRRFNSFRAEYN